MNPMYSTQNIRSFQRKIWVAFYSTDVKLQLSPPSMTAVVPKMCLQQSDAQVSDDTVRYYLHWPAKLAWLAVSITSTYTLVPSLDSVFRPSGICFRPSVPARGISHRQGYSTLEKDVVVIISI